MKKLSKEYYSKKDGQLLEKGIQREICEFLNAHGFFFWRSNNIPAFGRSNDGFSRFRSMPKFSMRGVPDIIVVKDGLFIGIEVKRPGRKISLDQAQFMKKCLDNGARYHVVDSVQSLKECGHPFHID